MAFEIKPDSIVKIHGIDRKTNDNVTVFVKYEQMVPALIQIENECKYVGCALATSKEIKMYEESLND